jgi:hypothetical protein
MLEVDIATARGDVAIREDDLATITVDDLRKLDIAGRTDAGIYRGRRADAGTTPCKETAIGVGPRLRNKI